MRDPDCLICKLLPYGACDYHTEKTHWWVWRGEWVEIEPGDIFAMNEDETCYILDEDEDPNDVLGAILLLSESA